VKRAGLIINPKAGRGASIDARLDEMISVFGKYGFEVDIRRTTAEPESACDHAAQASESCNIVVARGGDGTVHGVLQGIAETSTHLGVVPFGTAAWLDLGCTSA
jgi:diacylglycerol kinase (ATP)